MRHALLKDAKRIVIKLGTGILTDSHNHPDLVRMERLVGQFSELHAAGKEIVVVSSGAVGAGMGALNLERRPPDLAELQACAAVGQSRLMSTYADLFSERKITAAQVLLTHEDLKHHDRHLNARNTLVALLGQDIVPVINENDAVSFTELKFGDNDRLSALVACLLPADLLIVLTSVDGLIEGFGSSKPRVIPVIEKIDKSIEKLARGTTSITSTGGMLTKIDAAKMTSRAGIPMLIASGKKKQVLRRILSGKEEGTLFQPAPSKLKGRKRWIAFFHKPVGTYYVDDGAKTALRENGTSLLPPGILRIEGDFHKGDVVRICDREGTEFARGISRVSSSDFHRAEIGRKEVIHRNNLVIL